MTGREKVTDGIQLSVFKRLLFDFKVSKLDVVANPCNLSTEP